MASDIEIYQSWVLRTTWLPLLADYDSYAILSHVLHKCGQVKKVSSENDFYLNENRRFISCQRFWMYPHFDKEALGKYFIDVKLYLCSEKVLEDLCTITRWLDGPGKDDSTGTM